jgi:hypothetical protein
MLVMSGHFYNAAFLQAQCRSIILLGSAVIGLPGSFDSSQRLR